MSIFRKSIAFFLLAAVLCMFPAAAFAEEDITGLYSCELLNMDGESYPASEVYLSGCTLTLSERGKATLIIDGKSLFCQWRQEGERFILSLASERFEGSVSDGLIHMDMDGIGFYFLREGALMPQLAQSGLADAADNGGLALWNGDWYGQWRIFNASGRWAEFDGQGFDLFARILVSDEGRGSMLIWDEKLSADDPMAEFELGIVGWGENVMGAAMVEGGWFWQMEPESGRWGFGSNIAGFDRLIALEKAHYESDEGSFDFTLLLRPWGLSWDDVAEIDPASLPIHYFDWYLPTVEQGKGMPSAFECVTTSGESAG